MKYRFFELVVVAACLCIFGYYIFTSNNVESMKIQDNVVIQTERTIEIELMGEVVAPGKYTVRQGTSLYDVIYEAGGVTNDADLRLYNLSEPLIDSGQIYIQGYNGAAASERGLPEVTLREKTSGDTYSAENKCNINTATPEQLSALPGIGEAISKAIAEYRTQNGGFKQIDDIKNVKGIGKSKFEAIKDLITVGEENNSN